MTTLTKEQENLFREVYEPRYVDLALSCERIDRDIVPDAAKFLSEKLKEKCPRQIICEGPNDCWVEIKKLLGITGPLTFSQPGFIGSFEAPLLSWGRFRIDELGHDLSEYNFEEFHRISVPLHCAWVHPDAYVFCERPLFYKLNHENQMHCEDGPCVEYRDGTKNWFINGIVVDEQIVMNPQSQTIKDIQSDDNNDRRNIRIKRFGWARYLDETEAETLDQFDNVVQGTYEVLFRTKLGYNVMLGVDPSSDIVHLPVPAEVETCEDARTWLDGGKKYNVLGRT